MKTLFVDSRDRVSGSQCDFTIQLSQTLNLTDRLHRMRVDLLRVPVSIPTIQTGKNDTIIVRIGSTNYTATTIPPHCLNSSLMDPVWQAHSKASSQPPPLGVGRFRILLITSLYQSLAQTLSRLLEGSMPLSCCHAPSLRLLITIVLVMSQSSEKMSFS